MEKRSGASVWTAGSYDPQLNLAYFGVGQTYDTGPLLHSINKPGITSDSLYTDSTLALIRTPASSRGTSSTCTTISGTWIGHSSRK